MVCDFEDDRCVWVYQRLNSSFELFGMGCSRAQFCKELPQLCQEAVSSNTLECCDGSCCDSDFCNKLRYTGKEKILHASKIDANRNIVLTVVEIR